MSEPTNEPGFRYGFIAQAMFRVLLWLTVVIGFTAPLLLAVYVPFLLFLAFGLRPLLVKTGLHQRFSNAVFKLGERRYRKLTEQRCREVEAEKRKAKYKYRRYNDPNLPKNW